MDITDKQLIDTFERIDKVWGISRKGLIISLNGARVGVWQWNREGMFINPQSAQFRKDFRELSKSGILIHQPVKIEKNEDVDDTISSSILRTIPIARASPGELDSALKEIGYFMIETDLNLGES